MEEYTFRRINNYDIFYDKYINDIYSIFYKGFEIKNIGRKLTIEVISKTNLNINIINVNNIIQKQKLEQIYVTFNILDIFECEQNFYIVFEDFLNKQFTNIPVNLENDLIEKIFISLQKVFIFIIDHSLLCDSINYDSIYQNKQSNTIKILLRPQKKKKLVVYGSPIYSPHHRRNNSDKINGDIEENLVTNIAILMYEMIIKKIHLESTHILYPYNLLTHITNNDSIFSDFLYNLFDPNIDLKTKSNFIRNIKDIKNVNRNIEDKNNDTDIFNFEL